MPTKDGAGSLPCTVAVLIGTYSDWLAETLRHGSQGQAQGQPQGSGQAQGQQLVSQLLQLLMQCMRPQLKLSNNNNVNVDNNYSNYNFIVLVSWCMHLL